jgi:hypothetical protein
MVSQRDYTQEVINACKNVLLEVASLIKEDRSIVLVGGWVPELVLPSKERPHVGTVDVDLAIDISKMQEKELQSIVDLFRKKGYEQSESPAIFYRKVTINNREYRIQVDLLTETDFLKDKDVDLFKVVQKIHGCGLVFDSPLEVPLVGQLPDGTSATAIVRVARIPHFLIMKAFALEERRKPKDAYDIYYCVKYYPGDTAKLAKDFRSLLNNDLATEGLRILAKNFSSENARGPRLVAQSENLLEREESERVQRDAYERVRDLLQRLGF